MIHAAKNEARVAELHPTVAAKARDWLYTLGQLGIEVLVTATYRSPEEQARLYAKGRNAAGKVIDRKAVVTDARPGESYHQWRLCFDFVPCDHAGIARWDGDFDLPARIAKQLGFEWGGDWKGLVDKPHLQFTFGLSIKDLQSGKKPPEPASFTSGWWLFDLKAWKRRLARLAKRA